MAGMQVVSYDIDVVAYAEVCHVRGHFHVNETELNLPRRRMNPCSNLPFVESDHAPPRL